ncbi:MAG: hypothetical protein IT318_05485 [Anaerolineales bacterium]|nr:hypothetical protein [Anaerolineales bacterium]
MRARLLRLLAKLPVSARRLALARLFRSTAAAFQHEMVSLRGLSREQCLREYARFTAERAEAALRGEDDLARIEARLYRNAYRLGRGLGRLLGIRGIADAMTVGRLLYDLLDIDFEGSAGGEITISRCYFSAVYSPEVCGVMSAMDHGLLAGLAGGGDLVFVQRLSEGAPCCRARFALAPCSAAAGRRQEQRP